MYVRDGLGAARRTAIAGSAIALLGAIAFVGVVPAAARSIVWGSSLAASPTRAVGGRYTTDAEFWLTAVGPARRRGVIAKARAPRSGTITAVRLKVGDDSAAVPIRFSVVRPGRHGTVQVLTTSTPALTLPAHSPGIHVFHFGRLRHRVPINKGDYLAISTPGVTPSAMVWYGVVAGASTKSYSHTGPTQSPGAVWSGSTHASVELLMQVVERPGRAYHFHLPPR